MNDLLRFREQIQNAHVTRENISHWSIGMHLHHCGLAMKGIYKALIVSTPPPPRSRFSLLRTIIFFTGRIPRGRSKSPSVVLPNKDISQEQLSALFDEVEKLANTATALEPQKWFKHHVFGFLNRDQAFRFIEIHNQHHLRIIEDILST